MTVPANVLVNAAVRLHNYLLERHWDGEALSGPDPGIRFNARIGRFVKSYLGFLPWSDNYRYLQAQGYWIFDNWTMADLFSNQRCQETALACSHYVLKSQRIEGYWEYPNPEWKGRIATVEGVFGTLALLESYTRTGQEPLLAGAKSWYRFLAEGVGFQGGGEVLAVNYFAGVPRGMVPNNSTLVLWVLARLAEATGDDEYLSRCGPMVTWLSRVQLETGELPYSVAGGGTGDRPHFLCYQYNAFEFMDLVQYHLITSDQRVVPILERLAGYLAGGISRSGAARYDCYHQGPEVVYYTMAVGAALSSATRLGLGEYRSIADLAFNRVLSQQREDGGFDFHSAGNYVLLRDRRSYPRYLSMILYHLLQELKVHRQPAASDKPGLPRLQPTERAADLAREVVARQSQQE